MSLCPGAWLNLHKCFRFNKMLSYLCSSPNPCNSLLFQSHLTVLYVPTLGTLLLTCSHLCPIFNTDFGKALPFKALLEHVMLKVGSYARLSWMLQSFQPLPCTYRQLLPSNSSTSLKPVSPQLTSLSNWRMASWPWVSACVSLMSSSHWGNSGVWSINDFIGANLITALQDGSSMHHPVGILS